MGGSNTVLVGTASGLVKARTIKRLPPGERWTGTLLDEALGSELDTISHWKMMALELGSERLCCNHTRQFLCLHWRLKFDRYDERHCTELTLSGLDTQTLALDVPTQEQVVN